MIIGSVILAGGRSRRMGQPKEALPYAGSTLLGHAVDTMMACCHPVVVMARDERQELPPLPIEVEVAFDPEPGAGPLVALAGGLRAVAGRCDAVFATVCDAPFVTGAVVDWLVRELGDHDLVIPRVDGRLQPLTAMYRTSVLPAVDALIAEGERRPRALAERVRTRVLEEAEVDAFDPQRRFLRGVNTPEEYQAILAEAGEA